MKDCFIYVEDNRLQGYRETWKGESAYYNYTAGGKRNLKFTGQTIDISQNGDEYNKPILEHPTLYASELVTISNKGYTKHYFEEGKRICSKIGVGFRREEIYGDKVEPVSYNYDEQKNMQRKGVMETFNMCMGVEPEIIEEGIKGIEEALNNEIGRQGNELAYYYHSDHLGSASYITDDSGAVTQTLNYLPYGEDWVDLQNFNVMPAESNLGVYKFNGKEKDAESGYNYYGARYYDSEKLSWLSVDPMSDKYPSLSPYVYCANNPVKLIDPNGEEIWVSDQGNGKYKITGGKLDNDRSIYLVDGKGKKTKNTIGRTLTKYSFFDEEGEAVKGAVIDTKDNSGKDFIRKMDKSSITAGEYAFWARNTKKYDFKYLGYSSDEGSTDIYYNRGMKLDGIRGVEGSNVYGSARDVGNYVAGMICAKNGLNWIETRAGFDAYQSIVNKKLSIESQVSQSAQYLGFKSYGGNWNYISTVSCFRGFSNAFRRIKR
jgi:RHS repeat-associated protein